MNIERFKFSYDELVESGLEPTKIRRLVDFKMNKLGFFKESKLADKVGIERQTLNQRIADHPERFKIEWYGGFKYVKEVK
jgi:hypothetical protein